MTGSELDTPAKVVGFNHINVSVRDMDAALRFWQEALGLELLGRGRVRYQHLDVIVGQDGSDIEWAELRLPTGLVELFRYHAPTGVPIDTTVINPGTAHVCLEVDDVRAMTSRLQRMGYRSEAAQPVRIPTGDWADWLCIYFHDPDGFTLELVQRP